MSAYVGCPIRDWPAPLTSRNVTGSPARNTADRSRLGSGHVRGDQEAGRTRRFGRQAARADHFIGPARWITSVARTSSVNARSRFTRRVPGNHRGAFRRSSWPRPGQVANCCPTTSPAVGRGRRSRHHSGRQRVHSGVPGSREQPAERGPAGVDAAAARERRSRPPWWRPSRRCGPAPSGTSSRGSCARSPGPAAERPTRTGPPWCARHRPGWRRSRG